MTQRDCSYLNAVTKITRAKSFYGSRNTLNATITSHIYYRCQKIEFKKIVALRFSNRNTILTNLQLTKEIVVI